MNYTVTPLTVIDFSPSNEINEIIQNVKCIISTIKGSVPLDRDFGIYGSFIDMPQHQAQQLLRVSIIEAIETYEPRAVVLSIDFQNTNASDGKVNPLVTFRING